VACLPIPNFVLLPACTATLHIGPAGLLRQIALARQSNGLVCLVEASHYQAGRGPIGCLAEITTVTRQATGWLVSFRGLCRLRLLLELQTDQGPWVNGRELPSLPWCSGPPPEFPQLPPQIAQFRDQVQPGVWLDIAALHLPLPMALRQRLLAETDPNQRALLLRQSSPVVAPPVRCHLN